MLERIPTALGSALRRARAGADALTHANEAFRTVPDLIAVTSPAFVDGGTIPKRYTADGEGMSPPLAWTGVPMGTQQLVLMIEDADSPTPLPLVHAIAWDLPALDGHLPEDALQAPTTPGAWVSLGKTSTLRLAWLPPHPPRAHGPHRFAFQLFALDHHVVFRIPPGRREVVRAMEGHTIAKGILFGVVERRE